MEKKDVIIIGAGLAGLAAASMLAKKGIPSLVLEESSEPGGRARVIVKDGYTLEYGIHTWRYAEKSSVQRIMTELGLTPEWLKEDHKNWMIKGKDLFPIPGGAEKVGDDIKKFFHRPEIEKVRDGLLKLLSEKPEKLYRKSLAEFWGKLLEDEKAALLVKLIGLQVMESDPVKLSAGELLAHFKRAMDAGVTSAQLKGGSRAFLDGMAAAVQGAGGEIKLKNRALAVSVEKGRVVSVDTSEGVYEPGVLIYAGALHQLFRIASPSLFSEKLVRKVKKLEPVSGVAIDYGLREKVSDLAGWLIEPEFGIMGKFTSNIDSSLAPVGKQLASWLIVMPPDKVSDPEAVRASIHKLRNQIARVFPDFAGLTDWERILVMPVMDGAALSPRQSQVDRPPIEVPGVANLLLAGDAVAAPGASGEIAMASGMIAAEKCAGLLGQGRLI